MKGVFQYIIIFYIAIVKNSLKRLNMMYFNVIKIFMAGISRFLKNEVKNCAGKQSVTVVKSGASVTKIANYELMSGRTDYFVSRCI